MAARPKDATQAPKRARGRPLSAATGVGRDGLIAAARKLLAILPPSKITASRIAREAGADPALIRYYFGDRTALLMAVVEDFATAGRQPLPPLDADAAGEIEKRIHELVVFNRRAQSMQRLMIDELAESKSAAVRDRVRDLNQGAVNYYAHVLDAHRAHPLRAVDPLFLHLAMIGLCEFFVAAQPLVRRMVEPGADLEEVTARYEAFVVDLVLNGLKRRGDPPPPGPANKVDR